MTSSKKWGLGCLITPFVGLVLVLIVWSITSFVIGQYVSTGPVMNTGAEAMAAIINVVLGLLGMIFVILIPAGLIVGIILLVKKDKAQEQTPMPATTIPAQESASEPKSTAASSVQHEVPQTSTVETPSEKPAEPSADKPQEPTPGQNQ